MKPSENFGLTTAGNKLTIPAFFASLSEELDVCEKLHNKRERMQAMPNAPLRIMQ